MAGFSTNGNTATAVYFLEVNNALGSRILANTTNLYVASYVNYDAWLQDATVDSVNNPNNLTMSGIAGLGAGSSFWSFFNPNLISSSNPATIGIQLTNFTDWTSFNPKNLSNSAESPVLTAGFQLSGSSTGVITVPTVTSIESLL